MESTQVTNLPMSFSKANKSQCIKGFSAIYVCSKKNCNEHSLLCQNKSCQCYKKHDKCIKSLIQSMEAIIYQNTVSSRPVEQKIQTIFEQAINQLSEYRDSLIAELKKRYQFFGMNDLQRAFLDGLYSGQTSQLTCSFVWKLTNSLEDKWDQIRDIEVINAGLQKVWKQFEDQFVKFNKGINLSFERFNKKGQVNQLFETSKVIKSQDLDKIISFFSTESIKQATIVYRASQNDFSANEFHKICDDMPNTFLVCLTQFGKVLGAFTPVKWDSKITQYATDITGKSFLFSLTLNQKFILRKPQNSVYRNSEYGPTFGSGHNFHISDKANSNQNSYFYVSESYANVNFISNSDQASRQLGGNPTGHYAFRIYQWQVWQLKLEPKKQQGK